MCHDLEDKTGSEPYRSIAIISCLGDDELSQFVDGVSCLRYDDFREAVSCLKRRYSFGSTGLLKRTLLEEYSNFCKIVQLFDSKMAKEKELFNPHFYVLKYCTEELKKLEGYLREKNEKYNNSETIQQSDYV